MAKNIGLFESGADWGIPEVVGQTDPMVCLGCPKEASSHGAFWPGASSEEHQQELEQFPARHPQDRKEVSDHDFKELLLRRLKQLVSERDYRIYEMISFEGYSPQDVAERINVSRVAVDTILCRVRKAARVELERLGESIG